MIFPIRISMVSVCWSFLVTILGFWLQILSSRLLMLIFVWFPNFLLTCMERKGWLRRSASGLNIEEAVQLFTLRAPKLQLGIVCGTIWVILILLICFWRGQSRRVWKSRESCLFMLGCLMALRWLGLLQPIPSIPSYAGSFRYIFSQIAQSSVQGLMCGYTNFATGHLANKNAMISVEELIQSQSETNLRDHE